MDQQMRYLIAVIDEHSFTQAAYKCNISQSAISQQIKELENELGVTLLKRTGRSFEVTPAGQYFYQHAKTIVGSIDDLVAETRKMVKKEQDRYILRIGYLIDLGTQELLQAIAKFSQKYPQVKVQLTSGTHEELFKLLQNDQIDVNFSDQRRALSNAYENKLLADAQFMAVIPEQSFAGKSQLTTAELVDTPCILVAGDTPEEEEQAYARGVLGIRSRFIRANSADEAQMLVAAGQGFTVINERMKNKVNSVNKALPLYSGDNPLHQRYFAFWKADNSGFYIESFTDYLKQEFE